MAAAWNDSSPITESRGRTVKLFLRWWLLGEGPTVRKSSSKAPLLALGVFLALDLVGFWLFGVHNAAQQAAAQKNPMENHGKGLAFCGLLIGPFMMFVGQRRFRPRNGGSLGRWMAARAIGPIMAIIGVVGLIMVIVAA